MACIQICEQKLYNRNLDYGQALDYIQSQSYLLDQDFNNDIRFQVRQGQAFEAIENFEENIAKQFEKYGNTYGNDIKRFVDSEEPHFRKKRAFLPSWAPRILSPPFTFGGDRMPPWPLCHLTEYKTETVRRRRDVEVYTMPFPLNHCQRFSTNLHLEKIIF